MHKCVLLLKNFFMTIFSTNQWSAPYLCPLYKLVSNHTGKQWTWIKPKFFEVLTMAICLNFFCSYTLYSPKNNLISTLQTDPVTVRLADATVYVWILGQMRDHKSYRHTYSILYHDICSCCDRSTVYAQAVFTRKFKNKGVCRNKLTTQKLSSLLRFW